MSPVNGIVAPVCPISRSQAPSATPPVIPVLTRAADLPSVIQTVNQLVMIQQTTMLFPNYIPRWKEVKRNTVIVRVYNPNDSEQWVDVERITNLVFQDRTSNAFFQWLY